MSTLKVKDAGIGFVREHIPINHIPYGTVFRAVVNNRSNASLFLKGKGVIIDLKEPGKTYFRAEDPLIISYREVKATLTVE